MVADIKKNWEHAHVDLTTAGTPKKVAILRGGESITIKALSGNSGMAYIGSSQSVSSSNGFELDSSETLTLSLPITFGVNNFVEVWADTSNSGDDVCWVKLIGLFPSTEASSEPAAA